MKNSIKITKLLALLFLSVFTFTACVDEHDHDEHDHEEELITTVNYVLTNGDDVVTLNYVDLDGEGGNEGKYTVSGSLKADTPYTGVITLLNAIESPAEDITEEVQEEGDEHEFFYSSTAGVTIAKTDVDGNGNPLGIKTLLTTSDAGGGTLTVILKHEPTKPNNNTADDAGGSTDLKVTFTITVQ